MKIEVNGLTKQFGKKTALNHLDFTLEGSKIYGLLGRNGAGKTTFMNLLAGHQFPTKGEILVDGQMPYTDQSTLSNICLVNESNNFFRDIYVKDVLKAYRYFYPKWNERLAKEMMAIYKLPYKGKIKSLSKGMVSALGVIVGLASQANITVFDEPYIGMDAANRKKFYDILMTEMTESPRTIIFSTHLIDEVSLLFEEILMIQEGQLIMQKTADQLRKEAYAVSGDIDKVKAFIQNKRVLEKKQMAQMMTAYVYEPLPEFYDKSLNIEGIPIQDLMIYLTEENQEVS